jgi:RNA polymerase sigma-70 factor, ECF subfamily
MAAAGTAYAIQPNIGTLASDANVEQLEVLVSNELPRFFRQAYRQLGNVHDAEDALQDAFLSAYQHLSQFRGHARLSTWLMSIVINTARMHLRRRRTAHISFDRQMGLEEDGVSLWETLSDHRPGPDEICGSVEVRNLLAQSIDQLSPSLRRTFTTYYVHGLNAVEAAKALGIPVGTVKAQLARARVKLVTSLRKTLGLPQCVNAVR